MQKLETIGGLTCRTVQNLDESEQPRLAVILCHGFGAPGTDLVPLGTQLLRVSPLLSEHVQFVFPEAPLSLDHVGLYGGRAWWMLDVAKLAAAVQSGEFRSLRGEHPPGLDEARAKLMAVIDEIRGRTGLPAQRIVLGGFSQGSMLATDVALHMDERPAGLCIWSGTLLCEDEWKGLAAKRGPLRVVQSHGYADPILPFEAATWLRDLFEMSNFEGELIEFEGGHEIPGQVVARFAQMLISLIQDQSESTSAP